MSVVLEAARQRQPSIEPSPCIVQDRAGQMVVEMAASPIDPFKFDDWKKRLARHLVGKFTTVHFLCTFPSAALTGQSFVVSHGWFMQ